MPTLTFTTEFAAPRERVFAAFTDLEHAAENVSAIVRVEVLTDGPIGAGTRFRETRIMFRREATEEMEITAFDPPRSYTVEADSCGTHWRTTFEFTQIDAGTTRVDVEFVLTPINLFAKIMMPLTGWMMMKPMRKCVEDDLADLKRVCEGAAQADQVQPA